jgi:Ca2+-binding RTX toxin-like protein
MAALNVTDNSLFTHVQMGDLFVRGTENNDTIQFGATFTLNTANINLNTSSYTLALGPAATAKTFVYGRSGDDTVQQGSLDRAAEYYGGEGNDYLSGANRNDLLVGGWGKDRLLGKEGSNELWGDNIGEQDSDLAVGKTGDDNMSAGAGSDVIYGGAGADSITAGGGVDYAYAGYGDDTVDAGDGNDRMYGGPGADTITGGNGNDLLAGNAGADRLYGGAGNDVVLGGDGADYLTGDANDDLLFDGGVTVSSPSGSDASTRFSDSNDQAMLALLNDWNDNLQVDLTITSNHDSAADSLSGGLGNDTASKSTGDTGDWENTIP